MDASDIHNVWALFKVAGDPESIDVATGGGAVAMEGPATEEAEAAATTLV